MARYVDEMITRFGVEGEKSVVGAFERSGQSAKSFAERNEKLLDTLAYVGPYAQQVGSSMANMANQMVGAYENAEQVDQQLASMYKVKGYSDEQVASVHELASEMQHLSGINDEATKKSAALMASFDMKPGQILELMPYMASQADLTKTSLESVAMAIGRAFGGGQYGMLSRYGFTLDATAKATLRQAQAMATSTDATERARSKTMAYDVIIQALSENVPPLTDRMATHIAQQERFNSRLDDLRENMGVGVSDMQKWAYAVGYDGVNALMGLDEQTQKTAGKILYLGGYALKAAGSAGMMYRDYRMLSAQLQMAQAITGRQAAATRGLAAANRAAAVSGNSMALSLSTIGATALVAAAAIAAAYLVYRDYQVVAETSDTLKDVREGNEAIAAQAEGLRQRGIAGDVQGVEERGWWGNLWSSFSGDWSEEDTTSVRTTGGLRRKPTSRRNARGDLQISVPGAGYGEQQVRDYVNLH